MNTRQARKARSIVQESRYYAHRPSWGHLEQTVFLISLALDTSIEEATEVWQRLQGKPMVSTLPELADLVRVTRLEIWNDKFPAYN